MGAFWHSAFSPFAFDTDFPHMVRQLVDPIAGNLGLLLDGNTVILLPFSEPVGVQPSDRAGSLTDLVGDAAPDAGSDWMPWANPALWTFTTCLTASDQPNATTVLTRDVTVQAIVAAVQGTYSAPLIARGAGTGGDYRSFAVELKCANTDELQVRWSWQDLSGVVHADAWHTFTWDPTTPTAPILLTCTRRWESSTSVVMRYYVDDQLIAETTSTNGEIGGDTAGVTTVGGDASDVLTGVGIDQLKVTNHEMSAEEVRAVWRRLTEYQPEGVAEIRAVSPPGAPYLRASADSDIGRLIKVAGEAIGFAGSKAHELRDTFLPSSAYKEMIARWETLVGLPSNDRVPLDTRRARVMGLLERDNGYAPPQIQSALEEAFDLDSSDIELLEFSPTIVETFTTLEDERWYAEPSAAWSIDPDVNVDLNALQVSRLAGADIRFDPTTALSPCHLRMPVDNDEGLIAQVKLVTYWADLPSTAIVGLYLYNRLTNDSLWFGVKNDGGTRKLGWVQLKAGVLGSFTALANPSTDAAYYLRITRNTAEGSYELFWSLTDFVAGSKVNISSSIQDVEWAGVAAMATASGLGSNLLATFDNFTCRIPHGDRAFHWYAYRDPMLPGTPDMFAAQNIVRTIKPAHTYAYAITSLSLLCDDTGSGCDAGPMGGI